MLCDKLCESVYAIPAAAADLKERRPRIDSLIVGAYPCLVKVKIRYHIIFIKYKTVCIGEHERVFLYLVVAFRYAQDRDAKRFADPKLRGAYEVSDIFYKDDVQVIQRKFGQYMLNAHRFDVACAVSVELYSGNPERSDTLRIDLTCDITLDDADAKVFF